MASAFLPGDRLLTPAELARYALAAGFTATPDTSAPMAVSIAIRESGGHTRARNTNSDQFHSVDRGIMQLNDHWHPEISDAQADDPAEAMRQAFRISGGGRSWQPWSTAADAGNARNLATARQAVQEAAGGAGGAAAPQPTGTTSQAPASPCGPYNLDMLGYELLRAGADDDAITTGVESAAKLAGALPAPERGGYSGGSLYICGDNATHAGETLWALTPDQVNGAGGSVASLKTLAGHAAVFVRLWKDSAGGGFLPADLRGPYPLDAAFLAKLKRPDFNPYTGTGYDPGAAQEGLNIDVMGAVLAALQQVGGFLALLANPEFWKRAGLVLGGTALLAGAAWLLFSPTSSMVAAATGKE